MSETQHEIATSMRQVAQWMYAGLKVERKWKRGNTACSHQWENIPHRHGLDIFDWLYRIAIEPFEPEVGDDVIAIREFKNGGTKKVPAELYGFHKGQYICADRNSDGLNIELYSEVKPLSVEKPVAREGWVNPRFIAPNKRSIDDVYFHEILKGEE